MAWYPPLWEFDPGDGICVLVLTQDYLAFRIAKGPAPVGTNLLPCVCMIEGDPGTPAAPQWTTNLQYDNQADAIADWSNMPAVYGVPGNSFWYDPDDI